MKDFIDNVSKIGVEAELLRQLPLLFTPEKVWELHEDKVRLMAAESHKAVRERTELTAKLDVLEASMVKLKKHEGPKLKRPRTQAQNKEAQRYRQKRKLL
jgi:hypothetical protein